jgi:hypothetical protein
MHVTETGPALRHLGQSFPFQQTISTQATSYLCAGSVTPHNTPPQERTRELPRFRLTSLPAGNTAESNTEGYQYAPNMLDDSTIPHLIIPKCLTMLLPSQTAAILVC